jgi:acyl carrier protein
MRAKLPEHTKPIPKADRLHVENGDTDPTRYEELLAQIVRGIVPGLDSAEPAANVPLSSYGIGSLMLAEILTAIEERFGVVFEPADDLGDPVTVHGLAAQLASKTTRVRDE